MFFLSQYFKNKKEKKAFFLIEVLLAIFLVLVGFLAIISLATSGLRESMDSRDQIIAGLLVQEGAELVRNIRDNNWAGGGDSFDNSNFPNSDRNNCRIDINSTDIENCGNSYDLYYSGSGFYNHDASGTQTKFKRKIELDYSPGGSKLTVTSMVVWGGSFPTIANCTVVNKCVYVKTILTKWGEPNP